MKNIHLRNIRKEMKTAFFTPGVGYREELKPIDNKVDDLFVQG